MGTNTTERVLVYENQPATGARMTAVFAMGTFVFSLFLAYYVFTNMRTSGELMPLTQRVVCASILAAMGVGFLAWSWVHNRKVTTRIFYRGGDDAIEVEHPTLFGSGSRIVKLAHVESSNFHAGDPRGENRVSAPWLRIGVRDGRAFIVNLPGRIYRSDIFARLLERAGFDPRLAAQRQGLVEQHG